MSAAVAAEGAVVPPVANQVADEATDAIAEEGGFGRAGFGLAEYAIVALVALTVSVCVFAGGWFMFARTAPQKLGVIDLPSIVEIEEMSLTLSMMGESVTDDDRARAFMRVKGFGKRLETAIEQARQDCGCVLLTRNAMVGETGLDQTQRVKELLGMASVSAADLREKITKGVQAIPDGSRPGK